MRDNEFDQVISLGVMCQPAFQIRRIFGKGCCPSGIFDNQVTPHDSLIDYIRRDFKGLFERDDLETKDDHVFNRRFGTHHFHEFPADIDSGYQNARSRHDYLCGKTRDVLRGSKTTLFVVGSDSPERFIDQFSTLLSDLNPSLTFSVLPVEYIPTEHWQGDYARWERALRPYKIRPSIGDRLKAHLTFY